MSEHDRLRLDLLPETAVGLKLHRIDAKERLISCEGVIFTGGRGAVNTVLRRAAIAGHVEVGGTIKDHFADILNADGSWDETVSLDAASYRSLKTKWMRCKVEHHG